MQFAHDFIHVAPRPAFTGFHGTDDGMFAGMKVLGCVLVLRGIAAAHMATFHAHPKMDPAIASLDAILANVSFR